MSDRVFLDTNILVYAVDVAEPSKQSRAQAILAGAAEEYGTPVFILSTQVLQEFYVTVTRKLKRPLTSADAEEAVRHMMRLIVVQVDAEMILDAIEANQSQSVSFWDALILQAALRSGCTVLLSEDLNDGQQVGSVKVKNPF